jgi:hypothetical protein
MPTCGVSYWKEWSLSHYPNNFSTSRFAEPVGAKFKKHQSLEGCETPSPQARRQETYAKHYDYRRSRIHRLELRAKPVRAGV